MNAVFRLDASNQIGTGHFYRCLTIANRLKQKGALTRFICYTLPTSLIEVLQDLGHEYVELKHSPADTEDSDLLRTRHYDWIPTSQTIDAQKTLQSIEGLTWDLMIVDHYSLDAQWESLVKKHVKKIVVIDDLGDRNHQCDFLVDQNFYLDYKTRYETRVPKHCKLLLGPQYALLRDDIIAISPERNTFTPKVKEILVFMGGVDAQNYTIKVLKALSISNIKECSIHVVIGQSHPDRLGIQNYCEAHGFSCIVQTKNMANLMKTADLSIGAGGISVWERAYFGLPTITIEVAENQSQQIADAAAHGFVYSPDLQNDDWEVGLAHHITALANNYRLRELLSRNSQKVVDGKGVSRVVDHLSQTIFIRKATLNDLDLLFHWRNHPAIRAVSKNSEPIVYENHTAWFNKTLQSTEHQLLIATLQDGQEVGVIRFDQQDTCAEISIYLAPDQHRQGIGSELLRLGEQWMLENCQWVKEFRAVVLGENLASHRLFEKAAYSKDETIYFKKVKYES